MSGEDIVQLTGDAGLTIGTGQNTNKGDANLNRRQELRGFFGQLQGGFSPSVAPLGAGLQLGSLGGYDRKLGHGEKAVQHYEKEYDDNGDGQHRRGKKPVARRNIRNRSSLLGPNRV